MNVLSRSVMIAALVVTPVTMSWAQDMNPGNSGGGHEAIGIPDYGSDPTAHPALTTGSRYSVTPTTTTVENPTVPGATGMTIVKGDKSTISGDRRATIQQKTGAVTGSDGQGG